ncbi:thiamine diphosphokinase [Clostridium niameyense]|uniref:Thiamine diphosphokinase n=1 Tax=Clostridium niameyense TaxID=1622073 RepID=A0A6M0R8C5_9CLOT|nr:thiamine diphosphokinase [Clostridium niameyense]NEZ46017.1 thiamine diphosphokinase [Clostridium niameyense]
MKIVVIGGGDEPSESILKEEIKNSKYIVCADSGANCLYKYHIIPDYIMGDFDSIDKSVLNYFKNKNVIVENFPKDKDFTDGCLAVKKAIELKATEVVLLGCTGNRIDHVLGNLGLLGICLENNIRAYMRDNNNKIMLTNKSLILKSNSNKYFSLQAYGEVVKGVTLTNAKFPLKDYNLKMGDTLTTSNEFTKEDLHIDFKSGILMIIISND